MRNLQFVFFCCRYDTYQIIFCYSWSPGFFVVVVVFPGLLFMLNIL